MRARAAGARTIWAAVVHLRPGVREHFLEALERDWPEQVGATRRSSPRAHASVRPRPKPILEPVWRATAAVPSQDVVLAADRNRGSSRSRLASPEKEPADARRRIATVADEITCLIADDHEVVREDFASRCRDRRASA